ncbi:MAG: STAS domain-containing protein [Betaproteobacteria bacterium]
MALFSKPPAKKPAASGNVRAQGSVRATPARALAHDATRRTGIAQRPAAESAGPATLTGASLIDWGHAYAAIEVAQTNPGLCAVLENAALLYAAGQAEVARTTLAGGIENDHDTKRSPLAWLAMFDLLQRADQREAFDQLALQYVVQFERSAPGWEGSGRSDAPNPAAAGGYVAPAGKLTAASGAQLAGLRRAIDKRVANARLDLSSVVSFDDDGARLLADLLGEARHHRLALSVERPEKLVALVDAMVKRGKDGGQGAWLLSLELLQWQQEQATFDDRAVEFAVAFELSPPSWEPPPRVAAKAAAVLAPAAPRPALDAEYFTLSGVLAGSSVAQVAAFVDYAHRHDIVVVDMAGVERIDFVCAGSMLNAIGRVEGQRKSVQIVAASPIIRALLLLIGVSPRHFVKKAS